MGKITGFIDFSLKDRDSRSVTDRTQDYNEFVLPLPQELRKQGGRCGLRGSRIAIKDALLTT